MFCDEHGTQDYCGECIAESLEARIKGLEAIKAAAEEVIFQVYLDAPGTFHHDETAWDAMECLKAAIKALNTQEEVGND
jgi:hypothetical protein